MTAVLLVVIIGFVALVVDVGHLLAVRNEVQNAADSSALAGARALFPYQGYPNSKLVPVPDPPYCSLAVSTAVAAASENKADSQSNLAVAPGDVQLGIWDFTAKTFTSESSCSKAINALRVTIRKDSLANQPVAMWFARVLGIDSVDVAAQAVAAVGFVNGWPPGEFWNIAIQWKFLDEIRKGTASPYFYMNPDNLDNGGWCGPSDINVNANYLNDQLKGNGTEGLTFNDQVTLNNGVMGSVHMNLEKEIQIAMNNQKNTQYPSGWPTTDGQSTPGWLVALPVVAADKFNQETPLVDNLTGKPYTGLGQNAPFQLVVLTKVYKPNQSPLLNQWAIEFKLYNGSALCGVGGQTGGPASQVLATLPKLVR